MQKASPVEMRKALMAVDVYRKAGVLFVPMPVFDNDQYREAGIEAQRRLDDAVKKAESEE
jgi:hypothetical protein